MLAPWRKSYDKLDIVLKSRDVTLLTKVYIVKAMVFPSSNVQMWELDHKKGWMLSIWCFWTVVLEIFESLLDIKEIKYVIPKENKPWIFIGRTDAKAEAPILWPLDVKSWLIGKDLDARKDWGQEKGVTEDEMVGWHHWCNGLEFEQTLGDTEAQRSLACCSSWGHKELDTT